MGVAATDFRAAPMPDADELVDDVSELEKQELIDLPLWAMARRPGEIPMAKKQQNLDARRSLTRSAENQAREERMRSLGILAACGLMPLSGLGHRCDKPPI